MVTRKGPTNKEMDVIILAAGQGARMKSQCPKVLHYLGGRPLLHHVIQTAEALSPSRIVVVATSGDQGEAIKGSLSQLKGLQSPIEVAIQPQPLGTGDAVKAALPHLSEHSKEVLVLLADVPLITPPLLEKFYAYYTNHRTPNITVMSMVVDASSAYGRLICQGDQVLSIVEARNATKEQLSVSAGNSGILIAEKGLLQTLVKKIQVNSIGKEYYLTDIVGLAQEINIPCFHQLGPAEQLQGINTRIDLSKAERILQERWRQQAMLNGVTLLDPETTYFSYDTQVGPDTLIYPNVFFGPNVRIAHNVVIKPHCMLSDCTIEAFTTIGPFAHMRGSTTVGEKVHIGNFVELKASHISAGTSIKHLSYIGDTHIGHKVNIGAGTITCNYDGVKKSPTYIEDSVFVGSNSTLIAPVRLKRGSMTAAGSVITKDISEDSLGIGRSRQTEIKDFVTKFRQAPPKKTFSKK